MNVDNKNNKLIREDEIDLFDLFQVLIKRKSLILALFLIATICATVVVFIKPKIYKGEITLLLHGGLKADELINIMGKSLSGKMKEILPETSMQVSAIEFNPVEKSNNKVKVDIYVKNTQNIPSIATELVEYLNSSILIKRYTKQERERLLKRKEELSRLIKHSEVLAKDVENIIKRGQLSPLGFDPIQLNRRILNLKLEKLGVEQDLEVLTGVEVIWKFTYERSVKPKKKLIVALTGVSSLFLGIFLAFFVEFIEKARRQK